MTSRIVDKLVRHTLCCACTSFGGGVLTRGADDHYDRSAKRARDTVKILGAQARPSTVRRCGERRQRKHKSKDNHMYNSNPPATVHNGSSRGGHRSILPTQVAANAAPAKLQRHHRSQRGRRCAVARPPRCTRHRSTHGFFDRIYRLTISCCSTVSSLQYCADANADAMSTKGALHDRTKSVQFTHFVVLACSGRCVHCHVYIALRAQLTESDFTSRETADDVDTNRHSNFLCNTTHCRHHDCERHPRALIWAGLRTPTISSLVQTCTRLNTRASSPHRAHRPWIV